MRFEWPLYCNPHVARLIVKRHSFFGVHPGRGYTLMSSLSTATWGPVLVNAALYLGLLSTQLYPEIAA